MEYTGMRITFALLTLLTLAGCAWEPVAHYSTYDLNRDGVMDAVCPGMEYDTEQYSHYSWLPDGSARCDEKTEQSSDAS
jgi:hypothetical protein